MAVFRLNRCSLKTHTPAHNHSSLVVNSNIQLKDQHFDELSPERMCTIQQQTLVDMYYQNL